MTEIKIIENGPAIITPKGDDSHVEVRFFNEESASVLFVTAKSVAICRCGKSSNQPYCDGSHKTKTDG